MVMEKLVTLLADNLNIEPAEIKPTATFESLGIDSLDTFELVMSLEEELNIELEVSEQMKTVGEFAAYVEEKLKENA